MPKGLLDKLTREEILDLIAYIAEGRPESAGLPGRPRPRRAPSIEPPAACGVAYAASGRQRSLTNRLTGRYSVTRT